MITVTKCHASPGLGCVPVVFPPPAEADDSDEATIFWFRTSPFSDATCSPKLDPDLRRVFTARMGKEILDEGQETLPGPDHFQAA